MKADPARREAHSRLLRYRPGSKLREEPGAGLARELVYGVLRHRRTLDAVIAPFVRQRLATLEPELRTALEMAVWQFLFDTETPRPLVVASTVELAGKSRKRRGFLNAVLRTMAAALTPVDLGAAPDRARDIVPTSATVGCKVEGLVMPDPTEDLPGWLAVAYGVTPWFAAHVVAERPNDAEAVLRALNTSLPIAVRPTATKGTPEAARAAVVAANGCVTRDLGTVFEIAFEGDVGKFAPIRDGVVSVQDVVSASVAPFVDPKSGERIFDLCAGVGGKTMHLAELAPEAAIVAGDISEVRLATLRENAKRLGLTNVTTASLGLEGTRIPEGPFDRVLVDAPCSNSGVLMKRVEARDRLNEESIDEVVTLQETILKRAATCVKPGGVLVYATCSILREENRGTVDAFLLDHPGMFELVEDRTWWPHETGRDGGYVARLVRKS